MRLPLSVIFILTLLARISYGQTDSVTVYKNLKTKKFYSVSISYEFAGDKKLYIANEEEVKKSTFRKYERGWENLSNCCPCILKTYNQNDILIREGVSCTDCGVGYFKEYFPNGQVKLSGHYKENPTGNWDDLWERGYCNVPDGQWIYYDEKGKMLYSEYWDAGTFIKQVPEQLKAEIWKVELSLYGEHVNQKILLPNQLKELIITPKYKNAARDSSNLEIEFQVSAVGRKYLKQTFTLDSFKLFDLSKLLAENGFKAQDKIFYNLGVLSNQVELANFSIKLSIDLPMEAGNEISIKDSSNTFSRSSDFYLVNSFDSARKVKLVSDFTYELNYDEDATDSLVLNKSVTLQGFIVDLSNTSIRYDIRNESIFTTYRNGMNFRTENDYNSFADYGNNNFRSINLNKLNYIVYRSPSKENMRNLGYTTTFISVLTAAIVAPLASINYINGGFNKDRYFTIAGIGLMGLSVGIPLIVFSKSRTYRLTYRRNTQEKDYWYIQSEIKR